LKQNLPIQNSPRKLLPYEETIWQLKKFCAEEQLTARDTNTLILWLESFEKIQSDGRLCLDYLRVLDLLTNFTKYLESGDPTALVQQRGWKTDKLIDAVQFVEDKYYLGKLANPWPGAKDNLWQIWHEHPETREVVLSGSIRSAKSATVQFSFGYLGYLFSQMWNPFAEFDLSPASAIVILVQAPTKEKALEVIVTPLRQMMDASEYFKTHFPRQMHINTMICLPMNIRIQPITSEDTSALGENVNSYCQTESNFMAVTKGSKKLRFSNKETYHQARELYNKADERSEATFPSDHPMNFCKLFCDSSAENPEDFAHEKMKEAKTNPRILVIQKPIWEAQPVSRFPIDEPRFLMEVGSSHTISKILGDLPHDEIMTVTPKGTKPDWKSHVLKYAPSLGAQNPENCISVPIRLRLAFERDGETALKNFAGIVTELSGVFIPFADKIALCQSRHAELTGGRQIFKYPEISFQELFGKREPGDRVDWSELIDYDYFDECILDKTVPFAIAADLSATEDATGFVVKRINGFKLLDVGTVYNPQTGDFEMIENVRSPIYMTDGMLRIVAKQSEQIDPGLVAGLGLEIASRVNVEWGATDSAESSRAIRITWKRHGIFADVLSVDTTILPGLEVKHSVREERSLWPQHEVADREFRKVKKIIKNGKAKLEHPDDALGSKDIFDAESMTTWILHHKAHRYMTAEDIQDRRRQRSHGTSSKFGPTDPTARSGHLNRSGATSRRLRDRSSDDGGIRRVGRGVGSRRNLRLVI
jgi:hypothetical protein